MRFINTGFFVDNGISRAFDVVVSARSAYHVANPQLNGLQNGLAVISVACNSEVDLRVELKLSCDPPGATNCASCAAIIDTNARAACYQAGCACFGSMVVTETECTGASYDQRRMAYGCAAADVDIVFPTASDPVTMSILDFDGAVNQFGAYIEERVQLYRSTNWRSPLRAGLQYPAATVSTITVEEIPTTCQAGQSPPACKPASLRATSNEVGDATNDPTGLLDLTPAQASRGIQVFFTPERGYVDGTFSVVDTGVIRGFCTADRHFLLGGSSGLCYPPPSAPPPTPPISPPSSPPAPCLLNIGGDVCAYSLIVSGDAIVSSHSHYKPFAIGGTLHDGTPTEHATVGGYSYVFNPSGDVLRNRFQFQAGVAYRQIIPFDWSALEHLARTIQSIDYPSYHRIFVVCAGGYYTMSSLFSEGSALAQSSGYSVLVVFNTDQQVTIGSSWQGRPFSASILAPFSHVIIDDNAGYVDGFIVAKSLSMGRRGGSVQMHGRCFNGLPSGGCYGADTCGRGRGGGGDCVDTKGTTKCIRKLRKGKCSRKQRVREVVCRQTCGSCQTFG